MARVPTLRYQNKPGRQPDTMPVIKPEGKFKRSSQIQVVTDRSPRDVTGINQDGMKPILPGMTYIPPA